MSIFTERLTTLLEEQHQTFAIISQELGIAKNSMTYWKANGNLPKGDTLNKLAEHFGVSADYLTGKTNQKTPVSPFDDGQMQECIVLYRGGKPQVFHCSQKQLDILASLLEQFNDNNL